MHDLLIRRTNKLLIRAVVTTFHPSLEVKSSPVPRYGHRDGMLEKWPGMRGVFETAEQLVCGWPS